MKDWESRRLSRVKILKIIKNVSDYFMEQVDWVFVENYVYNETEEIIYFYSEIFINVLSFTIKHKKLIENIAFFMKIFL